MIGNPELNQVKCFFIKRKGKYPTHSNHIALGRVISISQIEPTKMRFTLLLVLVISLFFSCSDDCDTTLSYYADIPIYSLKDSVLEAIEVQESRPIETPEKLYFKDNFIFIVESGKGIHVIDNSNAANPIQIKFIQIPGNHDVAIKDNYLYADNYIDLLVFDVSDIQNINLHNRIDNVFDFYGGYYMHSSLDDLMILTGFREELIEETITGDCDGNGGFLWWGNSSDDVAFTTAELSSGGVSSGGSGTGGSMARFTINNNSLYTVDNQSIRYFDLADPSKPVPNSPIQVGWGIETIFPYNDNLFIGSQTGMFIYDVSKPDDPTYLSVFEHANACDPVVVEGDIAYVTLRNGTECQTFTNQLDVIDVSDLQSPRLIKSYPMDNPHGLGIKDNCLYICEGEGGLKYFDATDPQNITLLKHYKDLHALDVIPLPNQLLMIGNDGFHQYEGYCTDEIYYLSTIAF